MRDKGYIEIEPMGLGSEPSGSGSRSERVSGGSSKRSTSTLEIKDNEWKKAIFRSWDEFKSARREVVPRLRGILDTIPDEIAASEKRIRELSASAEKLRAVLEDIESIDDSKWDRASLQSELASANRKVEGARIESMLFTAKFSEGGKGGSSVGNAAQPPPSSSVIHELTSLSFKQAAKLGWGFFFPLLVGILLGTLLLSLMNYLAMHY